MITERQIEFCKQICGLAKVWGLHDLEGKFSCSFFVPGQGNDFESKGEVTFRWNSGRHGDTANEISVNAVQPIHLKVDLS